MGPISQGTLNDLNNLAVLVQALSAPEGVAAVAADLKAQMDAVVAKGAEVSEREASLAERASAVAAAEVRYATLIANAEGKNADAQKRLDAADRKLAAANSAQAAFEGAQAEFSANATKLSAELTERDIALDAKGAEIERLWLAANDAKQEYEGKLAELKKITG